jgi:hypothetical protein
MANKLEAFLSDNKIDSRRLLTASRQLERLRPADRATKLAQRQARKREDGKLPEGLKKPRSGRPVTTVGLENAFADKRLSGPAKNRILRAVNAVLALRKKDAIALDALFDLAPAKAAPAKAAETGKD